MWGGRVRSVVVGLLVGFCDVFGGFRLGILVLVSLSMITVNRRTGSGIGLLPICCTIVMLLMSNVLFLELTSGNIVSIPSPEIRTVLDRSEA